MSIKTTYERATPSVNDIADQVEQNPKATHTFLYEDNGTFRAYAINDWHIGEASIQGFLEDDLVVAIDTDTPWRIVSNKHISFYTGEEYATRNVRELTQDRDWKVKFDALAGRPNELPTVENKPIGLSIEDFEAQLKKSYL